MDATVRRAMLQHISDSATDEEITELVRHLVQYRADQRAQRGPAPEDTRPRNLFERPPGDQVIQFGPYRGMTFDRQYQLYRRGVALGADGEFLKDGETVYVLADGYLGPCVKEIDYFHGIAVISRGEGPSAQMDDDSDVFSSHMISTSRENKTIRNIVKAQRLFRSRRQQTAARENHWNPRARYRNNETRSA